MLGHRRRTTHPVARREEGQDMVIGQGQGGADQQAVDQGGAQNNNPPPEDENPFYPGPIRAQDIQDEEEVDMQSALRATNVVESLLHTYGITSEYIPIQMALEMVMDMATNPERHDLQHAFGAATRPDDCPRSFKEAMSRPDGDKWLEAAQTEMDALIENGTWELTELPEGRREVGSRWVFIIKRKADGTIDRYKARLVAKGYSQIPGIDFDQVFSPATRLASLRTVLAQAAMRGEYIESIDISNAYLNGEIEDQYEVYMTQPEGFKVNSPDGRKWVCKLKKGLYGLKQSGRLWYHKLATELENIGFTQIKSDPSIYVWAKDGIRVTLPVFVDDITITSKSKSKIQEVKDALRKVFKVKDLGPTTYLLGIKVDYNQENRILELSQT
ncbi:hypothetical protein H1R20_g8860, partial [Candolleomyces eurysporus]